MAIALATVVPTEFTQSQHANSRSRSDMCMMTGRLLLQRFVVANTLGAVVVKPSISFSWFLCHASLLQISFIFGQVAGSNFQCESAIAIRALLRPCSTGSQQWHAVSMCTVLSARRERDLSTPVDCARNVRSSDVSRTQSKAGLQ